MPTRVIAEIFGLPPTALHPPVELHGCPFRAELYAAYHNAGSQRGWNTDCNKSSHVCSIHQGNSGPVPPQIQPHTIVATCPARFYEPHIIRDVATHVWQKPADATFDVADEVSIGGTWKLDHALFERDDNGDVCDFCSIEIQAIDITNSIRQHAESYCRGRPLPANTKHPGLNWANATIKRLFTQLLFKGYMHHAWGKKIAVIIQDKTLDYIEDTVTLATVSNMANADICILPYAYTVDNTRNRYTLQLVEDRIKRMPYGSFALSTLSVEIPDISAHQADFVKRMI